jgi:hypothetical protein
MRAPDFIWGPGRVDEGVRYAEELVERLGHVPGVQQFALHLHAHMRARLGEFDGALEAIGTYRNNVRELGKEREFAATANCVWDVCTWSGNVQHGEEKLREAYALLDRTGNKALLSEVTRGIAEAALARRDLDEAERFCELGEDATVSEDIESEGHVALLRAKIRAARGDLTVAEQDARHAIELCSETTFLERGADAWLTLGEILRAIGEAGDDTAAREALALYERKGNIVGAGWVRAFLDGGTARPGVSAPS